MTRLYSQKTHFKYNNLSRSKVLEWKNINHGNINSKKAVVPTFTSVKYI